ncbi:hypothetical protein [Rhodovulum strictum]|uniref:Sulfotransferase family protein n=1 Tax=Rhodovulum strictum TaxID=58314 RepID=A0A844B4J9_9RHOB|nr:hypothetical protein [Rhodovulum strictum]MRH20630.1 hypothetical protein [Rhodovulum strictum]
MLILHIGSPKTGTTALQQFLHDNEDALRARGINYVRAARAHLAHNPLALAIAEGDGARLLADVLRECDAAPDRLHVLSSEILFRSIVTQRMPRDLAAALRGRVRVICYLRRQDRYAEAIYKQRAKNGLALDDRAAFLDGFLPRLRYSQVLGDYADLMGEAALHLRPFDRRLLPEGDIVADFAAECLGIDDLTGFARAGGDANPTLSVELSEMLGRIAGERLGNVRELIREIARLPPDDLAVSRDTFTPAQLRAVMDHVAADNAALCARFRPDLAALFDLSDLDDPQAGAALAPEAVARRSRAGALALARAMQIVAERTPPPAAPQPPEPPALPLWLTEIGPAGPRKGFCHWLGHHGVVFVDRGPGQLLVSFDNLHNVGDTRPDRAPWAAKLAAERGWSHLGVMSRRPDWFRDPALIDWFHDAAARGFLAGFARVGFAGASMGGFGALAFSALAPGATVIAFSPQSTLAPDLVPWEQRFAPGRAADWTLGFGDAAHSVAAADRAWIVYDPFHRADRQHADRLSGPNVTHLRAPGLGHKSALVLNRMGCLKAVMTGAIEGSLTRAGFHAMIRARRTVYLYRQEMTAHLTARGQPDRATRLRAAFRRNRQRAAQ